VSVALSGRIVVLSPHFDDAVFSLGATLARSARTGGSVHLVNVFGNDPDADRAPSEWDAACGFRSAGEAARARRQEDRLACDLIGATTAALPFPDEDHGGGADVVEVADALADAAAGADLVLSPGYPLLHPDHVLVSRLLVGRLPMAGRLGFYVEQPYATWRLLGRGRRAWAAPTLTFGRSIRYAGAMALRRRSAWELQRPHLPDDFSRALGGEPRWEPATSERRDRMAKRQAVRAYSSQLRGFGPLVPERMALYEHSWGGEGVGLMLGVSG
jgi:LmbE family N-acetylglucosaminyl deacetylase